MAAAITAINANLAMPVGTAKTWRPPAHQLTRKPPANACECVARRDCADSIARTRRNCVRNKGGRKNCRHDPISAKEDGGQSKSSRRPNRSRARVDRGELETKSHEKKIDRADRRELDDVFQGASQADHPALCSEDAYCGAGSTSCDQGKEYQPRQSGQSIQRWIAPRPEIQNWWGIINAASINAKRVHSPPCRRNHGLAADLNRMRPADRASTAVEGLLSRATRKTYARTEPYRLGP